MTNRDINSYQLLTNNRLDVVFKILYLKYIHLKLFELADQVYDKHIEIITNGIYNEPNSKKKSLNDYKTAFNEIFNSIKREGFNRNISLIPISKDCSITNGSHRLASSIFFNKKVFTKESLEPSHNYDFKFFKERGMNINLIELAVSNYIQLSKNNYLAIIWPSANKKIDYFSYFKKVIYHKKFRLNAQGARNFVTLVYQDHKWIGTFDSAYNGAISKVSETFKNFSELHLIFFKEDSIKNVDKIKLSLRSVFGIGKSSIHITDNDRETRFLSKTLLNYNGFHFLNNAKPFRFEEFHKKLKIFRDHIFKNNMPLEDFVLCGSSTLGLYGIRDPKDLDYLSSNFDLKTEIIQNHFKEIKFYGKSREELIHDPSNYLFFNGFKFLSIERTLEFKKNRNEIKDQKDILILKKDKRKSFRLYYLYFLDKIILLKYRLVGKLIPITKKLGIYNFAKLIYKKINL